MRHSGSRRKLGDHMAKEDQPIPIEEVFKKGKSIPFTRDFEKHTLFSKKTYKQGKKAIITQPHRGLLDQITHVDVRSNDGERVCM